LLARRGSMYSSTSGFKEDFDWESADRILYRTALGMGNPIGQVVGALAAGYPMEWYGRKSVCNVGILWTTETD